MGLVTGHRAVLRGILRDRHPTPNHHPLLSEIVGLGYQTCKHADHVAAQLLGEDLENAKGGSVRYPVPQRTYMHGTTYGLILSYMVVKP